MPERKWHAFDVAQVIQELQADPQLGLNEGEVKARLERYGLNELKKEEKNLKKKKKINQRNYWNFLFKKKEECRLTLQKKK